LHGVVNPGAVWQEETRPRRDVVKEKELLISANLAMIPFRSFGEESLVFVEELLVGERDTSDTLNGLVFLVAEPVCG
jgi:hypothetical protein